MSQTEQAAVWNDGAHDAGSYGCNLNQQGTMAASDVGKEVQSGPTAGVGPAIVTIVLTLACWTIVPLFLKHFTNLIDGWTANGWRYGLSALIWLPLLLWAWQRKTLPKGLWKKAMVPSVLNAAAQVAFGLAPYYVDPGLMTFSLRFQIVFLMGGAALLFASERRMIRSPWFLAGIAMVVGGTLATIAFNPKGLGEGTGFGVVLAVSSGLLYAGYALAVRKFMTGMNPLVAFSAVSQITAVALFGLMFVFGRDKATGVLDHGMSVFALSGMQVFWLAMSALIGIGIGHSLYYYSIGRLGLAVSSGVVQLQPVTVSLVSAVIFHEQFTGLQWGTGLTAIAGAALMLVAQTQMSRRATEEMVPAGAVD
jgi:drug/metabolite transporter (DMT)-like permease